MDRITRLECGGLQLISYSDTETICWGEAFGKTLLPNSVISFFGDLGAGKTTFIKGLVRGASDYPIEQVNSPTFVYLNIYQGRQTVYHFDLYRLRDEEEFLSMGFDEVLFSGGICCIEWSERIHALLPEQHYSIKINHTSEWQRRIVINQFNSDEPIFI